MLKVMCWAAAVAILAAPASATGATLSDGTRLDNGARIPIEALETGEQALFPTASGPLFFAGHSIILEGAQVIAGYSSELAYILVLAGGAQLGDQRAGPGFMLLIPPWGDEPSVARFEARRLLDAWPVHESQSGARAATQRIAARQRLAIGLGRLQRTRFNVVASGNAADEPQRRKVIGGKAVRAIRFGGGDGLPQVVQQVMSGVAGALISGDAATLAQFIDPLPFGKESSAYRQVMAHSIIGQADWPKLLDGVQIVPGADESEWRLDGPAGVTLVQLRPTEGFPFVAAITTQVAQ